jgi:hypothetical protein
MATYLVTAACVVAKDGSEGGESYIYRGGFLGAGVPAAEKQRLVEAGLVKVVEHEAAAEVVGDEPPRAGKGSGRTEWAAYAAALGIHVGPDATRDDIIAAVDDQA